MKHASVYLTTSQWLLTSMSRTRAGVWVANFVVHRLTADCGDDELGTTLLASLEASQLDVAHPESWTLFHRQLREAINLPGHDLVMARARLVNVELFDSALVLTPHRNRGLKAGFEPLSNKQTVALAEAPALGEAIRLCVALCQ
jgi:hypothetical protein